MEIPPPECFAWLFGQFIDLYNASDSIITPATVESFQGIYQFRFTIYEVHLIFRMKNWAEDEKQKLLEEVNDA